MAGRPTGTDEKLLDTEIRFVERYLIHLDRERAYRETGLGSGRVAASAMRLWARPHVQRYLALRRKELSEAAGIDALRVVEEYKKVALFNARDLYNDDGTVKRIKDLDPNDAAAIAEVTVDEIVAGDRVIGITKKIKLASKIQALGDLAKHLGMFTEKVEVTGKDGEPLKILMEQIGVSPKSRIAPK